MFRKGIVYFANSGGLVQGWDISDLLAGGVSYRQVFRFWVGDDVDASLVMDQPGSCTSRPSTSGSTNARARWGSC